MLATGVHIQVTYTITGETELIKEGEKFKLVVPVWIMSDIQKKYIDETGLNPSDQLFLMWLWELLREAATVGELIDIIREDAHVWKW